MRLRGTPRKRKDKRMEYDEIPVQGATGQEPWPEDMPDTGGNDIPWDEHIDEYLQYIEGLNPDAAQAEYTSAAALELYDDMGRQAYVSPDGYAYPEGMEPADPDRNGQAYYVMDGQTYDNRNGQTYPAMDEQVYDNTDEQTYYDGDRQTHNNRSRQTFHDLDRHIYADSDAYNDTGRHTYSDMNRYQQPTRQSKKRKRRAARRRRIMASVFAVAVLLLVLGGGGWTILHFARLIPKKTARTEEPIAASTEAAPTTEEATTEEDPYGPYATADYVIHTPHVTENTITFDSNPYSLRYAGTTEAQTDSDGEATGEPTLDDIYPAITQTPVEGSLNAVSPDASNIGETQQLTSKYMVLINLSDDSIVAKRDSDIVVNPASMTKILTVLTASDIIEDLDDTYVITQNEINYVYAHDCSAVGFLDGETVTVKDLIYGTIVCSGADAAMGLATYCCGSQEAFVEKMNEKVAELGLSDTAHFTNVVGIYDEDLHCTMEDMAVILSTAMQNDLCREVLSTRTYTTTPDPSLLPDNKKDKEDTADGQTDTTADDTSDGQNNTTADGTTDDQNNTTADGQNATPADETSEEEIPESVMLVATTGIEISNWFMRRIEDKQTGGEVLGAKTGFVNASGFCCASYYKSASGTEYVCVTGDTYSSWRCIYDHVGIYRSLAK
ncbi:MAG: D-alanyl-D-alanine carboxypeptidase [Lachnospiraceae bacterium]|nr:D-alanyl-D-alanine carboxypeptidase [Lachnospiraceae bacterium]